MVIANAGEGFLVDWVSRWDGFTLVEVGRVVSLVLGTVELFGGVALGAVGTDVDDGAPRLADGEDVDG